MKVLITGASSGIGAAFAKEFHKLGYELILVSKDKTNLEKIKKLLDDKPKTIALDLASSFNCNKLYEKVKKENIDILINNAGFGLHGEFTTTSLEKELDMIDLNIKAVHILTKLFLKDMKKRNSGYILNVASAAGLLKGGPLMSTYYGTKNYVVSLTNALYQEIKEEKSNVYIGTLNPGAVDTNFNKVAGAQFSIKPVTAEYTAKYAIKKMFKKKLVIVPTISMKVSMFLSRFLPLKTLLKITYIAQNQKRK